MKHIKTFESFLNESSDESTATWDATNSTVVLTGRWMGDASIRCKDGKIETYFSGPRGDYSYALGVTCDSAKWEKTGAEIANALSTGIDLGGLISKPIDATAKKGAVEILKKYL